MSRPTNAVDFDAAVQLAIDSVADGHLGGEITLRLRNGRTMTLTLLPCAGRERSEMEDDMLDALGEANAPLTGEKWAEAAGYQYSGAFRRAIRGLVEGGRVINARPGYKLA